MIRAVEAQLVMPMTTTITSRVARIPKNSRVRAHDVQDDRGEDDRQDEGRAGPGRSP